MKHMKMERIESYETSSLKAQTPGDSPPQKKTQYGTQHKRKFDIQILR